jgi:hypothetical protein
VTSRKFAIRVGRTIMMVELRGVDVLGMQCVEVEASMAMEVDGGMLSYFRERMPLCSWNALRGQARVAFIYRVCQSLLQAVFDSQFTAAVKEFLEEQ